MMNLKDKFDDMGIDELLISIIMINVTGCKQVEANNAAVQIREQLNKRIDEHIEKTYLIDKKAQILLRLELQDIKKEIQK